MTTKNLLVELFVEELPPKALRKLGEAFGAALLAGLAKAVGIVRHRTIPGNLHFVTPTPRVATIRM